MSYLTKKKKSAKGILPDQQPHQRREKKRGWSPRSDIDQQKTKKMKRNYIIFMRKEPSYSKTLLEKATDTSREKGVGFTRAVRLRGQTVAARAQRKLS